VLDAFRILWQDLPYSSRLVADAERSPAARREIDVVVALSGAVAEAGESPDPSAQAFVRALDAGEHGPGYRTADPTSSNAVRVLTAHGAVGSELDTVILAGAEEGNFPSLSRPEPMFDLAALDRPISQSERNRIRLEDERRLFRMVLGRARTKVVLTASLSHAADSVATSRFVQERGVAWTPIPQGPFDEPVSVVAFEEPRPLTVEALRSLAPAVSPKKTWSGAVAGALGATAPPTRPAKDTTPPAAFALIRPRNRLKTRKRGLRFRWQRSRDSSGIRFYRLYVNGRRVRTLRDKDGPGGRDPKPRTRFRLRGGKHRWFVRAYDYAGNKRTSRAFKRSRGSRKSSVLYVERRRR